VKQRAMGYGNVGDAALDCRFTGIASTNLNLGTSSAGKYSERKKFKRPTRRRFE
jgi:hypothetical protein